MDYLKALLLCRSLEQKGLASLYLPPSNFVLAPSVEGCPEVVEALRIYQGACRLASSVTTLLQVSSVAMVAAIAFKLFV